MNKEELQSMTWHRFLKVVYIGFSIIVIGFGYLASYQNKFNSIQLKWESVMNWTFFYYWCFWSVVVLFIIRAIYLYITTGKLK